MHQPITLAKVRKETKITVPEGGWVILVSPDEPFSSHSAKRQELASRGDVNESYEVIVVGRMDNKYADLRFQTAKEKKAREEHAVKVEASLNQSVIDASKRQSSLEDAESKRLAEAHAAHVAKISAENDAIRTRK